MSVSRRTRNPRRADLSQHFLRSGSATRLIQATSISTGDLVIEIGAGRGALTKPILRRTDRLVAIEIDHFLAEKLRSDFGNKAKVVEGDFLAYELPTELYSIIGNIPFSKSTEIVRKIITAANPPRDAWLIVQQDFARRMCGFPVGTDSTWSLRLKPNWHLEILDRIKRTEFDPPPSVDSVLLHMSYRGRPIIDPDEFRNYEEFVTTAFRSGSSINKALRGHLSKLQIRRLAIDLNFSVDARTKDLVFEQWLSIFRFWFKMHGQNRKKI